MRKSLILFYLREKAWVFYFIFLMICSVSFILPGASFYNRNGMSVDKITLNRGITLLENDYIASCVPSSSRGATCIPMYLTLQEQGNLVLFKGDMNESTEHNKKKPNAMQLWQSGKQAIMQVKKNDVLLVSSQFRVIVSVQGDIVVLRGKERVFSIPNDELRAHPLLSEVIQISLF
jgi:hypothetical protein